MCGTAPTQIKKLAANARITDHQSTDSLLILAYPLTNLVLGYRLANAQGDL
jgi:hypothetical protein